MKYKIITTCLILLTGFYWPSLAQRVKGVSTVGMTVSDMDKAVAFYTQVLDFEKISEVELYGEPYEKLYGLFGLRIKVVKLQLGDEVLELTDYLTPGGRPVAVDSRSNDLWFQHIAIVVSDMDRAFERLRAHNVQFVSTAPQTIPVTNRAAAGIRAFYFRDPDQHNLELIYFPPDKGKEKWQQSPNQLFLGIDHTAIAVSETAASLKFYQDLLGLEVGGESFNTGTEQAHLNNVEHASLHITGMRASYGPGIEFLEYLEPKTGRPYPHGSRPDDLWHWQSTIEVDDLQKIQTSLSSAGITQVSSGLVLLDDSHALGFRQGLMVRDPDGHAVLLVETGQSPME